VTTEHLRSVWTSLRYGAETAVRIASAHEDFDVYDINVHPLVHIPMIKPVCHSSTVLEWPEVWGSYWRNLAGFARFGKEFEWLATKLRFDHHIAVSHFTKERLKAIHKIEEKDITVVPNGVDQKFLVQKSKTEYGKIVYVGRIAPHKNIDLLLSAYLKAKKDCKELSLHIIGDGPGLDSTRRKASELKDVYVHGYVPEDKLIEHLSSSWLFALPSEREGFSIACLEAMACGVPVIACNFPLNAAAKELVIDEWNGFTVETTPTALMKSFFDVERVWDELSRNAKNFAAKFSWDTTAELMENVYKMVSEKA
jgi:glycosyltransferase involved in cell wall biosynthesis